MNSKTTGLEFLQHVEERWPGGDDYEIPHRAVDGCIIIELLLIGWPCGMDPVLSDLRDAAGSEK